MPRTAQNLKNIVLDQKSKSTIGMRRIKFSSDRNRMIEISRWYLESKGNEKS